MTEMPEFLKPVLDIPFAPPALGLVALALAAFVANWVTRRVLLRLVEAFVKRTTFTWDDVLLDQGVLSRLAHVVPALIVSQGIVLVPDVPNALDVVVRNVALAYVALTIGLSIINLLNAGNELYEKTNPNAKARPIKGYLQLAKFFIFVFSAVIVVATLIERSPLLLLSGFGAMSAVLMLVFKDTILSLVASFQLASNDMLRVGDWIEMPSLGADGDVIDMALNTVKVQNWDKTITTIPTYKLIESSFKNWRGMQETGGRRIKRSLLIDQSSIRFLTNDERNRLKRFGLIDEYLEQKRIEIEAYNARLIEAGKDPVNTRRVTNIGTFRAYATFYLKAHPGVHQGLSLMVRQLAPEPTGLPLELYCFTNTVSWVPYEGIQADIFDHLIAILPEFGLRLYQQPSGADVTALGHALRARDDEDEEQSKTLSKSA